MGFPFAKATVDRANFVNFLVSSVSLEVEAGIVFSGSSSVNSLEDRLLLGSVFETNSLLEIAAIGTPSKARGLNEPLDRVVCCVGVLCNQPEFYTDTLFFHLDFAHHLQVQD